MTKVFIKCSVELLNYGDMATDRRKNAALNISTMAAGKPTMGDEYSVNFLQR